MTAIAGRPAGDLGQRLGERAGAVGVVGDVDEGRRLLGEQLEAAGHRQGRGHLGDAIRVQAPDRRGRGRVRPEVGLGGGHGEGEVAALEGPGGAQPHSLAGILGGLDQLRPALGGGPLRQRADLGADPAEHQGRGVAQDGELLGGDLELGLPQPLGVVEADRGQHRHPRGDRVGRVQPPSQPGLDHGGVEVGGGEGDEGGRGGDLELGHGLALLEGAVDGLGGLGRAGDGGGELGRADLARRRISTRSDQREGCGETQAPAATPCASSRAAVIRVTEDLPFVPTTWIEAKRCWGIPSIVQSRCIRSRPSFQPIGSSESR